jgi:multiple sugar transport system permease protein
MKIYKENKKILALLFISPSVLIMLIIIVFPLAYIIILSLQNMDLKVTGFANPIFIGLENYFELFKSDLFWMDLKTTIIYTVSVVFLCFIIGLTTALLLNNEFLGRRFFRALIILPWAIPCLVTCLIWNALLDPRNGVINFILVKFNIIDVGISWLYTSKTALISVIIISVWKLFPFATVTILAGLQTIPEELYEAAEIDGAKNYQKLIYITIPSLNFVFSIIIVLLTIWAIKMFSIIFVLTKGGPSRATETLVIKTYIESFRYFRMGYAAAISVTTLVIVSIFVIIYSFILRKQYD